MVWVSNLLLSLVCGLNGEIPRWGNWIWNEKKGKFGWNCGGNEMGDGI